MCKVSLSIIVPVYNEEDAIKNSINRNIEILQSSNFTFELILINDGSQDNSLNIIESSFSDLPFIKIISHEENGGIGEAIKTGLSICSGEDIICVPVDSPLNNEIFNSFVSNLRRTDIIVSYRRKRKGYSLRMKINSYIYHLLITLFFRIKLVDYNWIHCYNRKIFDEKKFTLDSSGIFIFAEILIQAHRRGYTISEIPVDQEMRLTGIATASKVSAIIKTLSEMIAFAFK